MKPNTAGVCSPPALFGFTCQPSNIPLITEPESAMPASLRSTSVHKPCTIAVIEQTTLRPILNPDNELQQQSCLEK
ncbi:MAG: hypothetical protein NTX06_10565 [Proteobacteria bacterium]|nr:hypothetical protein [Pseudomonadota bacterium]